MSGFDLPVRGRPRAAVVGSRRYRAPRPPERRDPPGHPGNRGGAHGDRCDPSPGHIRVRLPHGHRHHGPVAGPAQRQRASGHTSRRGWPTGGSRSTRRYSTLRSTNARLLVGTALRTRWSGRDNVSFRRVRASDLGPSRSPTQSVGRRSSGGDNPAARCSGPAEAASSAEPGRGSGPQRRYHVRIGGQGSAVRHWHRRGSEVVADAGDRVRSTPPAPRPGRDPGALPSHPNVCAAGRGR